MLYTTHLYFLVLYCNSPFAKLKLVPLTSYLLLCLFGNTAIVVFPKKRVTSFVGEL